MSACPDFLQLPAFRRRAQELRFYRRLAVAALAGSLIAALAALRLLLHGAALEHANTLLQDQLQALAPQRQASATLRADIATLEKRIALLQQLEPQRLQAARLLRGLGSSTTAGDDAGVQLRRVVLRDGRAELSGHARAMTAIQQYTDALAAAGLDGARLSDARIDGGAAGGPDDHRDSGYAFTLALPLQPPAARPGGAAR